MCIKPMTQIHTLVTVSGNRHACIPNPNNDTVGGITFKTPINVTVKYLVQCWEADFMQYNKLIKSITTYRVI